MSAPRPGCCLYAEHLLLPRSFLPCPRPLRRKGHFSACTSKNIIPCPVSPNPDGQGKFRSSALVKRQAVTGLAARARLAEDGAAHHLRLAVDAGRLLLTQLLSLAFRLQLLSRSRLHHFECNFFALVSAHRTPKGLSIVGINSRVLPGTADRHIELFSIHQLSTAHRVDIDYHTVHGGTLSRMGSGGVAVVDVPQLPEIDAKLALIVEPELGLRGSKLYYGREFSIGHLVLFVMDAELQAVAGGQLAMLPRVNLHALPFCGADFELPAIARAESQRIARPLHGRHREIAVLGNALLLMGAVEVDDFALLIDLRIAELRRSQISPHQNAMLAAMLSHVPMLNQQLADFPIEGPPLVIARADHQGFLSSFMAAQIIGGDALIARCRIGDFGDPLLLFEETEGLAWLTARR